MALQIKSSSGWSLLELLLVVTIISVIILGSTRFFSTTLANYKVSAAIQDIKTIRQAASEYALDYPNYNNISMAVLNSMGLLPENLAGPNASPWNTHLIVQANSQNVEQLQIVIACPFPATACLSLKSFLQNQVITPITPANCADVAAASSCSDFIATFG